tara:strand:+ start:173 stop:1063 length:891 start_codon:yes stop_codon:yes gene_type:complete
MKKLQNINNIKRNHIEGKNIFLLFHNKFFNYLSKQFGYKFFILFLISILIKIPGIISHFFRTSLNIKKPENILFQKNILRELNEFGFSLISDSCFSLSFIDKLSNSFYEKYAIEKISKITEPMIYEPLSKINLNKVLSIIEKNYMSMISKYLFMLPYLKTVTYMYSKNEKTLKNSSQYWHLDKTGPRTLKLFLSLHDQTEKNGPLTFIDSKRSEYLVNRFKYSKTNQFKRLSDELINKEFDNLKFKPSRFIDKKGSLAFLDTDRCLHYGSRKSENPRLFLYIEFGSYLDFKIPFLF